MRALRYGAIAIDETRKAAQTPSPALAIVLAEALDDALRTGGGKLGGESGDAWVAFALGE